LHNPPGEEDPLSLVEASKPSSESKDKEAHHHHEDPEVNQWVCIVFLLICIGILGFTAEWLILSADFVRNESHIEEE
jgi:Ca2+:H+ antiporter